MPFDALSFFSRPVTDVAADLIGARLGFAGAVGRIVETEAYHPTDPASHSFRGETPANRSMFLGPGRIYVYRSYGLHWCVNFVSAGNAAVLIRALEPLEGLDLMAARRGLADPRQLCAGPGRLTMALGIDKALDGQLLTESGLTLEPAAIRPPLSIGPRIGISKAVDLPWRFGLTGSRYLSRGFPKPK